jgi:hypothetical protein
MTVRHRLVQNKCTGVGGGERVSTFCALDLVWEQRLIILTVHPKDAEPENVRCARFDDLALFIIENWGFTTSSRIDLRHGSDERACDLTEDVQRKRP